MCNRFCTRPSKRVRRGYDTLLRPDTPRSSFARRFGQWSKNLKRLIRATCVAFNAAPVRRIELERGVVCLPNRRYRERGDRCFAVRREAEKRFLPRPNCCSKSCGPKARYATGSASNWTSCVASGRKTLLTIDREADVHAIDEQALAVLAHIKSHVRNLIENHAARSGNAVHPHAGPAGVEVEARVIW
jgi:hypothetical protein